jgi:hypothetical protein
MTLKEYADKTSARFVNTREVLRKDDIEYYNNRVNDLIEGRLKYAIFAPEDLNNKQYLPFINKLKENGFEPVEEMEYVLSKGGVNPKEEYAKLTTQPSTGISVVSEDYGVVVAETNPSEEKTKQFVEILLPQIKAQAYKENASGTANDMFMYGLRWTRKKGAIKPLNNRSYANGGLPVTDAKAKDGYVYDTLDQNGNSLAPISDLQPIIDTIQKALGIDMSNYDAVIGNIYLPGQNIATHRDTTESLSARNYPVIVYTIGNNSGISIYENEKNPGGPREHPCLPHSPPQGVLAEGVHIDDFVKSPSAALRFNFVVAAYLVVRFTPQFLRALHLELFTKPSFGGLFTRSSLLMNS